MPLVAIALGDSCSRSPLPSSPPRVTLSILSGCPPQFAGVFYTPGWREALWEWSALPKHTTQWSQPGLEPPNHQPPEATLSSVYMWKRSPWELSRLGKPKRLYEQKLFRFPGLPYLSRRDNSPTRVVFDLQIRLKSRFSARCDQTILSERINMGKVRAFQGTELVKK